jgi:hypothetical protein
MSTPQIIDPGTLQFPRYGFILNGKGRSYFTPAVMAALAGSALVECTYYVGWGSAQQINAVLDPLNAGGTHTTHYLVMSEINSTDPAQSDLRTACSTNGWLARKTTGEQVAWSNTYGAWDTNPTDTTPTDGNGNRYPQWLANRTLTNVAGYDLAGLKIDNCFGSPRTLYYNSGGSDWSATYTSQGANVDVTTIDTNWLNDGVARNNWDEAAGRKMRAGYAALVNSLRAGNPSLEIQGNLDTCGSSREYQCLFDSLQMEGLVGQTYGRYSAIAPLAAMQFYINCSKNVRNPVRNVMIGGSSTPSDIRHELCFVLMGDGIHCNTHSLPDGTLPDEWQPNLLGYPVDAAQYQPTSGTIWVRRFTKGIAFVNIGTTQQTINSLNLLLPAGVKGLKKLKGSASDGFNDGSVLGNSLTMNAKTGCVALYY